MKRKKIKKKKNKNIIKIIISIGYVVVLLKIPASLPN